MDYELSTTINPNSPVWADMVAHVKATGGKMLGLLSQPELRNVLQKADVAGTNVIDVETGRHIDQSSYLFFNKVPVPTGSKISVNEDWTVSVTLNGDEIAQEQWYAGTRRAVRELRYLNVDGTTDYVEEYAADGKLHSTLYYDDGELQEITFHNDAKMAVVRFFFYEQKLNYITVANPETNRVSRHYQSIDEFLTESLARLLTSQDTVIIRFMARELTALRRSHSRNVLVLSEPPRDESGAVRGNLAAILNNDISWIHEVRVPNQYYDELVKSGLPLIKVVRIG